MIRHARSVQNGERGGVERVLRDRDEDAALLVGADDVQEGVDSRRSAGGEVDVCLAGRESVTSWIKWEKDVRSWILSENPQPTRWGTVLTLEELRNALSDCWDAVAGAVSTNGTNLLKKPLCALNNIRLIA